MAMAEAFLAARYNREGHTVVDHYTYTLAGDGDLMEGVAAEAASLAGHLGLGKLIVLYDDNQITLAAPTKVTFSENVPQRFDAYGWHTLEVDGDRDLEGIAAAIQTAQAVTDRPTLISIKTTIGYGSPNKAGTSAAHGSPLGEEEIRLTKENLDWPLEPTFYIPEDVLSHYRQATERGSELEDVWEQRLAAYEVAYPELAAEFKAALAGELPDGWETDIPVFEADAKGTATRNSSGKVLNAIAARVPTFMGGDADLAGSTKSYINSDGDFGVDGFDQRNLRFGVREHGMGAIINGMTLHGGITKPYTATFLTFSDYMRPAVRLAALMEISPVFVFTHDSVGLGEDGPTHQPVEQLAALRTIPHGVVLRRRTPTETSSAWKVAMTHQGGPVMLIFTRQSVPTLEPSAIIEEWCFQRRIHSLGLRWHTDVLLMASGSEVHILLEAQALLATDNIQARVISLPSLELFQKQPASYIEAILPSTVKARVAIEAGVRQGWDALLQGGHFIGLDRFGGVCTIQDYL